MAHSAPAAGALLELRLTDFRSYGAAELRLEGRSAVLWGPNGAGKTNILEAVSLLSPGRGLRGAAAAEIGRREPGEAQGRRWAVQAELAAEPTPLMLATGVEAGASRRSVRADGAAAPPARLAEHVRPVWLTPQQDRLFLEAAADRRRFFDRLVFAAEPAHAAAAGAYERAMRERMRLLTAEEAAPDPAWLDALEARLGEAGALMATARARTLQALQAEIDSRADRPFPQGTLTLTGEWEALAAAGAEAAEIEARLRAALLAARPRDAAAGRALTGPHRGDLRVRHRERDRDAAECSTGEQKALLLNLILAQAQRLARAESAPNPILLLDEVAAHLDPMRRDALFGEIAATGLQALLTGADEALFAGMAPHALTVRVERSTLAVLDP